MTALERRRGLAAGRAGTIVLLESARGVWDIRSIITASRASRRWGSTRATSPATSHHPLPEHDPYVYARGRLVIEATAAKAQTHWHQLPARRPPARLSAAEIHRMGTDARIWG